MPMAITPRLSVGRECACSMMKFHDALYSLAGSVPACRLRGDERRSSCWIALVGTGPGNVIIDHRRFGGSKMR